MERMNKNLPQKRLRRIIWLLVLAVVAVVVCLAVLDQPHPDAHLEKIGKVHFETSCSSAAGARFDRALALLHSFEFAAAADGFHAVLKNDPNCAIAYWGIALSQWDNPFAGHRPPEVLSRAAANIQRGIALGAKTQREKDYLAAVAELYKDAVSVPERTRMLNYETSMGRMTPKRRSFLRWRWLRLRNLRTRPTPSNCRPLPSWRTQSKSSRTIPAQSII
jgi:hypothetical protein